MKQELSSANVSFVHKGIRFVFYDCYTPDISLEWLENTLEGNSQPVIFSAHQPVIPYNARANWHIFGRKNEMEKRQRLLNVLSRHNAVVLTAHLHKFTVLKREVPGSGMITQVALGSVIDNLNAQPKHEMSGIENYTHQLTDLEPGFAPDSIQERKDNLSGEQPFIRRFEYADMCGFAVFKVQPAGKYSIEIYKNADRMPWKTVDL